MSTGCVAVHTHNQTTWNKSQISHFDITKPFLSIVYNCIVFSFLKKLEAHQKCTVDLIKNVCT